jgi:hypothetical protein
MIKLMACMIFFYFLFQLLNYAATTLLFSDRKVDTNVISWNKVILLHGKNIFMCYFDRQKKTYLIQNLKKIME